MINVESCYNKFLPADQDKCLAYLILGWEPPKETQNMLCDCARVILSGVRPEDDSSLQWSWNKWSAHKRTWPDGTGSILVFYRGLPAFHVHLDCYDGTWEGFVRANEIAKGNTVSQ